MVTTSFISRLSRAVDLIEQRSQQNRPWKVVTVRRGYKEDPDAAEARHYAAHVGRLLALEDALDVSRRAPVRVDLINLYRAGSVLPFRRRSSPPPTR